MNNTGIHTGLVRAACIALTTFLLALLLTGCNESSRADRSSEESTPAQSRLVSKNDEALPWSERMAVSIMHRNPEAWMTDFRKTPRWSYTNGLVMMAFVKLWQETGKQEYFDYAKSYADTMIDSNGQIIDYEITEFNIDHINPGKFLFTLYDETGDERYRTAIEQLRSQLKWHPRTTAGGFWHKLRYPWQMWLDGLYMGAPFYAEYAGRYGPEDAFDDIVHQFELIEQHNKDHSTGLLYHGWDESHLQRWADPSTGVSSHFWGRGMGWYGMALVDVLDYIPEDHDKRNLIIGYLGEFAEAITKVQDNDSGLWYQILDMHDAKGNYHEATATCMYIYILVKAVNKGYIDNAYMPVAEKAFTGVVDELVRVEKNGDISLTSCCSVAGLGGSPYRDGSFEYYISEKVRSNDPKGTAPFILAVLEMQHYEQITQR